ncbi:hypothetical protein [Chroococcidiopsis sp. CCMEE 29]|uniref:hypothetical protein n=1 Tax=Chroococcidiopsis sp. CCMEE 29 TaxID=155894 RepID=UPI0020207864|nr:hypothetical protein [Chroococcidiopsis sp. CCMEE 29]
MVQNLEEFDNCGLLKLCATSKILRQVFSAELKHGGPAGRLYVESLTNVLAVHLLRNYSAAQPCVAL